MKIAIVRGPFLNPWEAQTFYPLMGEHEITFFGAKNNFFDVDAIPHKKLTRYIRISGTFISLPLFQLLNGFDIIHALETYHGFTFQCALHKKLSNVGFLTTQWENIPYLNPSIKGKIVKSFVKKNLDKIIAVTEVSRRALIKEGVDQNKIVVIPPGINTEKFKPFNSILRREFDENVIILFIGRLVEEKGIVELLEAMRIIWEDKLDLKLRLVICGKGPLKNLVLKMAEKYPITYIYEYTYNFMPQLYNACDIFVLPSKPTIGWEEQFGMVLIEAMACGKPIISTNSGSIPYVVDTNCSLLVNPGNVKELKDALSVLIYNDELRGIMGRNGRELALERYDSRNICGKLLKLYLSVLAN